MNMRYHAIIVNQYGRYLGSGDGDTREEAICAANASADEELLHANRNWKWRKARTTVAENEKWVAS